jgi:hypothetical protein
MSHARAAALMVALGLLLPTGPLSQTIIPSAGQSAEQTAADQAACAGEATAQSGYNPAAAPAAAEPARGERVRGAARGAAAGAVREQRTDADEREVEDLTESAARLGAVAGGARQRQDRRESRRDTQAAKQGQAAYVDIFSGCMTARGYTVQ